MRLFQRKIIFKSPVQSDLVIFERVGSQRIKEFVLPSHKEAYVLDTELEEIFISPKVFWYFLLYLRYFNFKGDNNNFSKSGRGLIGQLWCIYILSCLKCFSPKVVITLIDNQPVFHWLCQHYKGAEFMAIQNGSRTKVEFRDLKVPYRIGHFFCFGEYERDLYSQAGHKVDHFYPVGSLLCDQYKSLTGQKISHYDICIISSWRGNIGNGPDVQRTMTSMRKIDLFLARYIKEYGLKASIIMRSEPDSADRNIPVYGNEKEYLQSIYPQQVVLIDPNFKERNIYNEMDKGDFIISAASTAPREAFGWGKKILYCDFTGTDFYNDYEGTVLFKTEDYDLFKARLNEIRNMSYEEYHRKTKDYAAYLMAYHPDCPPHRVIRQKVEYFLSRQS